MKAIHWTSFMVFMCLMVPVFGILGGGIEVPSVTGLIVYDYDGSERPTDYIIMDNGKWRALLGGHEPLRSDEVSIPCPYCLSLYTTKLEERVDELEGEVAGWQSEHDRKQGGKYI